MGGTDEITYRRHRDLGSLESFHYHGPAKRLARHVHEEFQITLYEGTPHAFEVAGTNILGGSHSAVMIQAGEPHLSRPANDEPIRIFGLYAGVDVFDEAAASIWKGSATVAFASPLLDDPLTVQRLCDAHNALAAGGLEAEERFRLAIDWLLRRHATPIGSELHIGRVDRITRVRELLHETTCSSVSLAELADVAGLSRCHVIRAFSKRYGLTPFSYQRSLRVGRARDVLSSGGTIAAATAAGGFADQSHLGRHFVSAMGVTPGQYRRCFVERSAIAA
jgi:AraC-like DNA-binding protein